MPKPIILTEAQQANFWSRVSKSDGCWEWRDGCTAYGYGEVMYSKRLLYTHRIAWVLTNGQIEGKLRVCHTCDNPPCVRPDHLFLGTARQNSQDMVAKGRNYVPPPRRGEANNKAVLTESAVRDIRKRCGVGESIKQIADSIGVNSATVRAVLRRRTWRHVA